VTAAGPSADQQPPVPYSGLPGAVAGDEPSPAGSGAGVPDAGSASISGDEPSPAQPGPPAGFLVELAASFSRRRPQGTARWNFSDAFTRLEKRFGAPAPGIATSAVATGAVATGAGAPGAVATGAVATGERAGSPRPPAPAATTGAEAGEQLHGILHKLGDRSVAARLRPWIKELAPGATERALAEGLGRIEREMAGGFDATVEAFRFLAARVEAIEDLAKREKEPIDAVARLARPPALGEWSGQIADWIVDARPAGEVVHGECGEGDLAVALSEVGLTVRGAEPRADVAWQAAERGVDVYIGPIAELLGSMATGSLGGLVLSGVVDRAPLGELVGLLDLATGRLTPGAPLVVVGTRPEAVATGWDAVAQDLLPGRPLHAETWKLLLTRAGYEEVGRLLPGPSGGGGERGSTLAGAGGDTYAVKGRRPS